jgi:hypothetical protein
MTRLLQPAVWDKLHRRKVVQWAVVYAAGAWALLQGIDFLVNAFHWPEATPPVATLALLIGLPVVITLAWYHGDRGIQRVSAAELTIILLLLLLGGGLLWLFDRGSQPAPTVVDTEELMTRPDAAMPGDERPSIAVLPSSGTPCF